MTRGTTSKNLRMILTTEAMQWYPIIHFFIIKTWRPELILMAEMMIWKLNNLSITWVGRDRLSAAGNDRNDPYRDDYMETWLNNGRTAPRNTIDRAKNVAAI